MFAILFILLMSIRSWSPLKELYRRCTSSTTTADIFLNRTGYLHIRESRDSGVVIRKGVILSPLNSGWSPVRLDKGISR